MYLSTEKSFACFVFVFFFNYKTIFRQDTIVFILRDTGRVSEVGCSKKEDYSKNYSLTLKIKTTMYSTSHAIFILI